MCAIIRSLIMSESGKFYCQITNADCVSMPPFTKPPCQDCGLAQYAISRALLGMQKINIPAIEIRTVKHTPNRKKRQLKGELEIVYREAKKGVDTTYKYETSVREGRMFNIVVGIVDEEKIFE